MSETSGPFESGTTLAQLFAELLDLYEVVPLYVTDHDSDLPDKYGS